MAIVLILQLLAYIYLLNSEAYHILFILFILDLVIAIRHMSLNKNINKISWLSYIKLSVQKRTLVLAGLLFLVVGIIQPKEIKTINIEQAVSIFSAYLIFILMLSILFFVYKSYLEKGDS